MERRQTIEKDIAEVGNADVESVISVIVQEIESVERHICEATSESQLLLSKIHESSNKLEEARFLRDRYKNLRTQHIADIKRLQFIMDGERKKSSVRPSEEMPVLRFGYFT